MAYPNVGGAGPSLPHPSKPKAGLLGTPVRSVEKAGAPVPKSCRGRRKKQVLRCAQDDASSFFHSFWWAGGPCHTRDDRANGRLRNPGTSGAKKSQTLCEKPAMLLSFLRSATMHPRNGVASCLGTAKEFQGGASWFCFAAFVQACRLPPNGRQRCISAGLTRRTVI